MKWAIGLRTIVWVLVMAAWVPPAAAQEGDELAPPLGAPSAGAVAASASPDPGSGQQGTLPTDGAGIPLETVPSGPAGDLLPEDCEGTNRSLLVSAAVVDVVTLILFFITLAIATRRDWLKPGGAVRYFVVLIPFLVIAAVALNLLRPDVETVALCIERADFRHLLILVEQPTWLQCAALGSAPVLLVALMFPFIAAPFRRRK